MLENLLFFRVSRIAKVFGISRSGFYYWIKHRHKDCLREQARQALDGKVKEAFDNSKGRDGARRIQAELADSGDNPNVKTIASSMKRLVAKAARKFKCTTDSNHRLPVATNLLEQDFTATAPNQKWAGRYHLFSDQRGLVVIGCNH